MTVCCTNPSVHSKMPHPNAKLSEAVRGHVQHLAENANKALAAMATLKPDAVIVDISLEGRSGLELIKDLRDRYPRIPVLALSMHDEMLYAERALRAGARGYVMKKESTKDLITALRQVLEGGFHVSNRMAVRLIQQVANRETVPQHSPFDLLSDRELEVFQLIGQGEGTRQIGRYDARDQECHSEEAEAVQDEQRSQRLRAFSKAECRPDVACRDNRPRDHAECDAPKECELR